MTDRLLPGNNLVQGAQLVSQNGHFRLLLQEDGNLVLYNNENQALWNSGTHQRGGQIAILQEDGNFVIYAEGNVPVWSTHTHGNSIASLVLQDNGELVIFKTDGNTLWSSGDPGGYGRKILETIVTLPEPPGATARLKVYERRVSLALGFLGIDFTEQSMTKDGDTSFHISHRIPPLKHKFYFNTPFELKRLDFVYQLSNAGRVEIEKTYIGIVTW